MRCRSLFREPARRRGTLVAAALAVALGGGGPAASADEASDRGAALYGNHCATCHDETLHRREGRLVGSREELSGWVAGWGRHLGLDWGDEEVESVTSYLSRRLYRFSAR